MPCRASRDVPPHPAESVPRTLMSAADAEKSCAHSTRVLGVSARRARRAGTRQRRPRTSSGRDARRLPLTVNDGDKHVEWTVPADAAEGGLPGADGGNGARPRTPERPREVHIGRR